MLSKKRSSPVRVGIVPVLAKGFLINKTRSCVLAERGKVLRGLRMGFGAMFFGLPGSYVFVWWRPARIAITNLFVFIDLDVLWLDESWRVVDIAERFTAWSWKTENRTLAKYVIEVPAGTVAQTGTQLGDAIVCDELQL